MKPTWQLLRADGIRTMGVILVVVSALLFFATRNIHGDRFGVFLVHYLVAVVFAMTALVDSAGRFFQKFVNISNQRALLVLVLFFISCYSLNREMNVFDAATGWLSVLVTATCIALVLVSFFTDLPRALRHMVMFVLGFSLALFMYYTVYLAPLYLISVPGILALGLSLHSYVPATLLVCTCVFVTRSVREDQRLAYPLAAAIAIAVVAVTVFIIGYGRVNNKVNRVLADNILVESKVPAWIESAQLLHPGFVTDRYLKAGLVYTMVDVDHAFWFSGISPKSFDEPKEHDPLLVLAALWHGRPRLSDDERINILKGMYDARHHAQERLWSGDALETSSIITNVRIFPEYRLAYTEKTLSIRNTSHRASEQEAIYTFHLQEGSVVSSLSLWIDGKEQRSRLSTTAKADSVYKSIVGVERHDPSVVHWQEGNTVTVRVFPCTDRAERMFKIGITSPLHKDADNLVYHTPYFDGPGAGDAGETVQLTFSHQPNGFTVPAGFNEISEGVYRSEGRYRPDLTLNFPAAPLLPTAFSFNGASYRVSDYEPSVVSFDPAAVYVDVNAAWSRADFDTVCELAKRKHVFVYDGKLVALDGGNRDGLFDRLRGKRFSVFPFYKIADPAHSLVITKNAGPSPDFSDLRDSEFGKRLGAFLAGGRAVHVYSIGAELSPYLASLREMRAFVYDEGTLSALASVFARKRFHKDPESVSTVCLENARLLITRTADTTVPTDAPDHLLRLFAYNSILQRIGKDYFRENYVRPDLISDAQTAMIVTPVSSMIVLETQADYDRFGIDQNKNSLKNASMHSSGAVPEPHEWLLLALLAGVIAYAVYGPRFTQKTA